MSFNVTIFSPSDLEYLVAEIWKDDELVAVINQETGAYEVEIVCRKSGENWKFSLNEWIEVLEKAERRLNGKEP